MKHFSLAISLRDWSFQIELPEKTFPQKFWVEKNNFVCGGYFVVWEKELGKEEIFELAINKKWKELATLVADFIIFLVDKKGKQLFVLTSQTGTFPCYFSWIEDFFILSTSYGKIQKLLSEKTLNLNSAFDYFGFSFTNLPQDFTILEETKEVPPATLFQLNSKFYFRLIPLIRPEEFFGKKLEPFSSLGEFTNELTSLLKKIVKERRERIGNLPLAGELSSGYDSGLVAYALNEIGANDVVFYSWFSNEDLEDSDPRLVERFAQKHNLKVVFWDKSSFFPFFPNLVPRA